MNDAGYRDMAKIKAAGFNCVRLSHYPMDPAVLDACDDSACSSSPASRAGSSTIPTPDSSARVTTRHPGPVRRDRNHPCAMAWETSLNETYPPKEIAEKWVAVAHEEFPIPEMTAVGDGARGAPWDWVYNGWDEGTKARPQHDMPSAPGYIREYGDYEFGGAENDPGSRARRAKRARLQSAWNFVWSHDQGTAANGHGR